MNRILLKGVAMGEQKCTIQKIISHTGIGNTPGGTTTGDAIYILKHNIA